MNHSRLRRTLAVTLFAVTGTAAASAGSAVAADGSMIITGVVDGPLSGGIPKAVEVYVQSDITDLSAFGIGSANNGGGSDGEEFTFPAGSATAGSYLYVASESPGFQAFFGFAPDYTDSAASINGDDAIELFEDGVIVDVFGDPATDGTGQAWDHLDGWAKRISVADAPTTSFDVSAWTFSGINALDGESTNASAANPFPLGDGGDPPPPPPEPECDATAEELTLISEIQGSGFSSPIVGTSVTLRAVVTLADTDLNGYFVQEEPADNDGDPATSEGLFVFQGGSDLPVEGDTVELTGTVTEFFGLTRLSSPETAICDVEPIVIDPTPLVLPLDDVGRESLESMLVTNAQDLQVTGLFTAYRYGELGLALDGPLTQATSAFAPDDPQAAALEAENQTRELIVNDRDEAFGQFNPYPWERFDEGLSAGDTMPAGRLVGALNYNFGAFKVEPVDNEVGDPNDRIFFPETDDTVPVPAAPSLSDGNDIATFNVLNYFNTFGDSEVLRGATNQADFEVQTAKLVDAINQLDAAVIGLIEIENDYEDFYDGDPTTEPSIVTLVDSLNAAAGYDKWSYVQPPESILTTEGLGGGGLGTDAIANGIIYQGARAKTVLPATTFDIDALLTGDSENSRWPIAQSFVIDKGRVTVVVNHFKSKGSTCADTAGPGFGFGDDDGSTLAGNCDLTRRYAAERLVEWVETKGNPVFANGKVFLTGDFNSYEEEAPIEVLVDAGYVDLVQTMGDDAFTYKFSGRYGRLDYVFASSKIAKKVSDAEVWQINSPAPVGYLYDNDPIDESAHGSSDHDPVVISLR